MPSYWLAALPLVVALSGAALVLFDRAAFLLAALLLQYVALMLLTIGPLGAAVAVVKLLTGVVVVLLLWSALRAAGTAAELVGVGLVALRPFRAVGVLMVLTAGWGIGRAAWTQVPGMSSEAELSASMMLAVGLMQIALFQRPLRVGMGLLTLVAGFEVIYAAIEPSLAVAALLAGVHMGLAIVIGQLGALWSAQVSSEEPGP